MLCHTIISTQVPTFDRAEYDKVLANEEWTFEETKLLCDLCKDFDTRFVIVHDRYVARCEELTAVPANVRYVVA